MKDERESICEIRISITRLEMRPQIDVKITQEEMQKDDSDKDSNSSSQSVRDPVMDRERRKEGRSEE